MVRCGDGDTHHLEIQMGEIVSLELTLYSFELPEMNSSDQSTANSYGLSLSLQTPPVIICPKIYFLCHTYGGKWNRNQGQKRFQTLFKCRCSSTVMCANWPPIYPLNGYTWSFEKHTGETSNEWARLSEMFKIFICSVSVYLTEQLSQSSSKITLKKCLKVFTCKWILPSSF